MNENIEKQMKKLGYVKAEGMAILNDVAVTSTSTNVFSPMLKTKDSVDVFNNECDTQLWTLYRKSKATVIID